ncbi:MAG: hypothetical protein J6L05_06640 [Ruminococcus sp.]|nr:hypothetical protein [Ruminococcus sp.]
MKLLKNIRNIFVMKTKNNLSLAIYSILIAILAWFVISMTFYPSVPKTIKDIPVNIDISGTYAAENGLSVISCDVKSVDVQIRGSRTQVGNLNADSLTAYIDVENVSSTGQKTLSIKIRSDSGINYEVSSISPETAHVVFDKYDTKQFPVTPKIPNVSYAEGKTINPSEFTCEPDVISITGPSAKLAKISTVYAVSEKKLSLDSSYTLSSDEVQLYSEDGTLIDQSMMKLDTSSFMINIPVLTQKTVGLAVKLVYLPAEFDQSSVKLKMSADSITIASKNSQSEIPDILEIGSIPLSDLDMDYTRTFNITSILEASNMINMSDLETVTVTLDDAELAKKQITLGPENMKITNKPNNDYDYEILTKSLTIDIVGPANIIDDLVPSDFSADANLLNADTSSEQFTYDVSISCLASDKVWSVTKPKVKIQKTEKATEAEKADEEQE